MRRFTVLFLILPLMLSGCSKGSVSQANKTLTVSAIGIEKSESLVTVKIETVSKEGNGTGKTYEFTADSLIGAVKEADSTLAYTLIFSHCSALIIKGEVIKTDIDELLSLVSDRLLPLSCVVAVSNDEILSDKSTEIVGYELLDFFEIQEAENRLFTVLREYYSKGKITLPQISKVKEGYKWTRSETISPL